MKYNISHVLSNSVTCEGKVSMFLMLDPWKFALLLSFLALVTIERL